LLSEYAGVPYRELEWDCAGINHLAWFTTLRHRGQDLYPALKKKFAEEIQVGHREFDDGIVVSGATDPNRAVIRTKTKDLIRKDMCIHFGAYITESSGHLSEYLPYYRKPGDGRRLLRPAYDGGSRFYATHWPDWRATADRDRSDLLRGKKPMDWKRSWEYASWIIEAREKNVPFRVHANVMNQSAGGGSLIANLPASGCVEVANMVDGNGIRPTRYGALPAQMAAICASNMAMFDLGAQAAIDRSKEAAIHSLMLDPLTSAVCSPRQIKAMVLEMFEAEKTFLCEYR
jgi:alpha-galactosidase